MEKLWDFLLEAAGIGFIWFIAYSTGTFVKDFCGESKKDKVKTLLACAGNGSQRTAEKKRKRWRRLMCLKIGQRKNAE